MIRRVCGHVVTRSYYAGTREPMYPVPHAYPVVCKTAEQAVQWIKSGDRVFLHSAAATPQDLVTAMAVSAKERGLKDIKVVHIHTECTPTHLLPEYRSIFRDLSFFIGHNVRDAVNAGYADYCPIFLKDVPKLFRREILPVDVALIQCSPPDAKGYMSLGTSVDVTRAALQSAQKIIVQANINMPRTHGDGVLHVSHVDAIYYKDVPIYERKAEIPSPEEDAIGKLIAENLVEDGATMQLGIGSVPDAVLSYLTGHKDLGIHSEMFSDGILPLVEKGVITNIHKKSHPGKIVGGFTMGTRKLYDFLHDNPSVAMLDIEYVNAEEQIAKNPKVTAVNSSIEIDITGQIVSDSIGTKLFSGFGGQVDFIRGAAACPDGKPIIAMPSTTSKNVSKIVPFLKQGAGVVTGRADAHYVVTEWGIAHLFGKSVQDRARALIKIAHPDHRGHLVDAAKERFPGFHL